MFLECRDINSLYIKPAEEEIKATPRSYASGFYRIVVYETRNFIAAALQRLDTVLKFLTICDPWANF